MGEVDGSGKHASLLQYDNNYGRKKFYRSGPCRKNQKYFEEILTLKIEFTLGLLSKRQKVKFNKKFEKQKM